MISKIKNLDLVIKLAKPNDKELLNSFINYCYYNKYSIVNYNDINLKFTNEKPSIDCYINSKNYDIILYYLRIKSGDYIINNLLDNNNKSFIKEINNLKYELAATTIIDIRLKNNLISKYPLKNKENNYFKLTSNEEVFFLSMFFENPKIRKFKILNRVLKDSTYLLQGIYLSILKENFMLKNNLHINKKDTYIKLNKSSLCDEKYFSLITLYFSKFYKFDQFKELNIYYLLSKKNNILNINSIVVNPIRYKSKLWSYVYGEGYTNFTDKYNVEHFNPNSLKTLNYNYVCYGQDIFKNIVSTEFNLV